MTADRIVRLCRLTPAGPLPTPPVLGGGLSFGPRPACHAWLPVRRSPNGRPIEAARLVDAVDWAELEAVAAPAAEAETAALAIVEPPADLPSGEGFTFAVRFHDGERWQQTLGAHYPRPGGMRRILAAKSDRRDLGFRASVHYHHYAAVVVLPGEAIELIASHWRDGRERVLATWRWTGTAWEPAP